MKVILIFYSCLFSFNIFAEIYSAYSSVPNEKNLTRDELIKIIKRQSPKSMEDFFKVLSESDEDYKKQFFRNYALMFGSQSLQTSDFQNPRAIMFSDDARFVMTFNGHKGQRAGNRLEMMQFNEEKKSFEFFDINFDKNPPEVSSINPPICIKCHKKDARPNWEPYFFWQDAYGADDDIIIRQVGHLKSILGDSYQEEIANLLNKDNLNRHQELLEKLQKNGSMGLNLEAIKGFEEMLSSNEGLNYLKFLQTKEKHPRYSFLKPIENKDYFGSRVHRPNQRLNVLLNSLNGRRLSRKIGDDLGDHSKYRYAFLGAALCSYNLVDDESYKNQEYPLEKFIPEELLKDVPISPLGYIKQQNKVLKAAINERLDGYKTSTTDNPIGIGRLKYEHNTARPNIALVSYVAKLAGTNTDDWSMSFNNTPRIHNGGGTGFENPEFLQPLIDKWLSKDEDKDFFREPLYTKQTQHESSYAKKTSEVYFISTARRKKMCDYLSERSLETLKGEQIDDKALCILEKVNHPSEILSRGFEDLGIKDIMSHIEHPGSKVLNKCVTCHQSDNGFAPEIPFHDLNQLESHISKNSHFIEETSRRTHPDTAVDEAMPLGGPRLSKDERNDLLNYLRLIND